MVHVMISCYFILTLIKHSWTTPKHWQIAAGICKNHTPSSTSELQSMPLQRHITNGLWNLLGDWKIEHQVLVLHMMEKDNSAKWHTWSIWKKYPIQLMNYSWQIHPGHLSSPNPIKSEFSCALLVIVISEQGFQVNTWMVRKETSSLCCKLRTCPGWKFLCCLVSRKKIGDELEESSRCKQIRKTFC